MPGVRNCKASKGRIRKNAKNYGKETKKCRSTDNRCGSLPAKARGRKNSGAESRRKEGQKK